MRTENQSIIQLAPMFLMRHEAAQFLALSEATLAKLVARGEAPKPKKLSAGPAEWLVDDLVARGRGRPESDFLPPEDSGYARAGKPSTRQRR